MKNRIPFAALTFAFTFVGGSIQYGMRDNPDGAWFLIFILAAIGGMASAFSGVEQ